MIWLGLKKKSLSLLLINLTLRYPTWHSLSDWARKTIMPRPRSDEVIVLHPLVRFGKAGDKPDNRQPGLEVIPSVSL